MVLNGVSPTRTTTARPLGLPVPASARRHSTVSGRVSFSGDPNHAQQAKPSFQEKLTLGFQLLKKELQDPKSRNYLISGYITTGLTPALLLGAMLVPVAAPALWPMAALSGFWSGVILWESFQIVHGPFKTKK